MQYIDMDKVIYNFYIFIYKGLMSGSKIPKVKFVFEDDAYYLFKSNVKKVVKESKYLEEVCNKSIKDIFENKEDALEIHISDARLFFEKLTKLLNLYCGLIKKYDYNENINYVLEDFLRTGLWL